MRRFLCPTQTLVDIFVGVICLALLMVTAIGLPLVWDEPNAILRADKLEKWMTRWCLANPEIGSPWDARVIHDFCPYTTQIEGHPAFYGVVIAAGHAMTRRILPGWMSYRFGPMLLFSIATAACFHRLSKSFGRRGAIFGVAALVTMPRLFAHAHFASIDGPLTSCWMLTWATFEWARQSRWWGPITWGVLLGLTMSCKFTGWAAIAPFLAWAVLYRDRGAGRVCLIGGAVAILTFLDANPPLWADPVAGLNQFLEMNLNRAAHGNNIPTQFLGATYDLDHPLPWYNSLVWTVITVPPASLVFAMTGLVHTLRQADREGSGLLLVFNWAVLVIVRALPISPPHDAERLFLPSFAFLALMCGVGAHAMLGRTAFLTHVGHRFRVLALVIALGTSAVETIWYAPQWLSYYSPIVGGLRGATALGFEPAYYWDGLDDEVINWLKAHVRPEDRVYCQISRDFDELTQRELGLPFKFTSQSRGQCEWYLIQNRPSFWDETDRLTFEFEQPVFSKTIRHPAAGIGPWQLDVPVISVYTNIQFQNASQRVQRNRSSVE